MHAGLRFGPGGWPDLVCERLFDVKVAPVCAPENCKAGDGGLASAETLDRFTVLCPHARARASGMTGSKSAGLGGYRPRRTKAFDSVAGALRGRRGGLSLALVANHLVDLTTVAGRRLDAGVSMRRR